MMTSTENLYNALGQLAYVVAFADGKVHREEREKFERIIEAGLRCKDYSFTVADIAFRLASKDKIDVKTVYDWAMKEIRNNSHYLSPELKKAFIRVMEKIARAFPPVTIDERNILEKFREDIEPLKGDPVYYQQEVIK